MLPQDDPNSLTTESEEENDYQKENAILRENIAIVKRSIIENNNIIRLYNKSKEDNLRLSNKLESTKDELNNQLKEIKVLKSNELEVQGLQSQLKNISSSNAYLKSKLEEKSKIIEELQSKLRTMDTNPINHHTSNFEAIQKLEPSTQFNATNNDPSFLESFSNSMRYLDGPPSSSRTSSITLAKLLKEIPSPMGKFSNNESNSTNKGVEGNPSTPCASTRFPSPNSPGPVDRMHLLHSTSVVPSKINQATSHSTAVHLLPENVETLLSNALLHQTSHFLTQKRRLLAFQMFERWKLKVAQTKLVRLKNFVKQLEKQLAESEKKNSIQDKELDFFAQSGPLVNPPSQKSPEDQSELAHVKEENKLLSSKIKDIEEEQILLLKMITRLKSEKIQPKNTVSIGVSTTSAIMMDSGCQTNLEQVSKVSNNMIFDSTPASFGSPSASTPLNLDSPPSETSQNIVSITSKRNHTDSSPLNVPTESKKRSRRFIVDDEDFLIENSKVEGVLNTTVEIYDHVLESDRKLTSAIDDAKPISDEPLFIPESKVKEKLELHPPFTNIQTTQLHFPTIDTDSRDPDQPPLPFNNSLLVNVTNLQKNEKDIIATTSTHVPDLNSMEGIIQCAYDFPVFFLSNIGTIRQVMKAQSQSMNSFMKFLLFKINEFQKKLQWIFSEETSTVTSNIDQRDEFLQPSGHTASFRVPRNEVEILQIDTALPLHEQTALLLITMFSDQSLKWTKVLYENARKSISAFRLFILSPHVHMASIHVFFLDSLIIKSPFLISYLSHLILFRPDVLDSFIHSSETKDPLAFMIRFSLSKQIKRLLNSFNKSKVPTFVHHWLQKYIFTMPETIHAFPLSYIAEISNQTQSEFLLMKCTQLYLSACISLAEKQELVSFFLAKRLNQLPKYVLLRVLDLILQNFDSHWKPTQTDVSELEKLIKGCPVSASTEIKRILRHLNNGNSKLTLSLYTSIPT